jgi:hypothetical protein
MNVLSKFCLSIFLCNTKKHIETQNTNDTKDIETQNTKNIVKAVGNDIMENLETVREQINTLNAKTDTES